MADGGVSSDVGGLLSNLLLEIIKSPINIALVGVITLLVYKIVKSRQRVPEPVEVEPELPKLRKDFTVEELKKYDGHGQDGRVLVAVNGKVFDVTKGKRFYGPGVVTLFIYKIWKSRRREPEPVVFEPELPKLRKDFTVQELKKYDGHGDDGRILVAICGKVYDVTKGKRFYGPGGPYSAFGGRDASRGLATFSVVSAKDEYDDLSDLNSMEMESVREWEMQFKEKYEYVGRLLKPGEQPTNYSDEEEEGSQQETPATEKPKEE